MVETKPQSTGVASKGRSASPGLKASKPAPSSEEPKAAPVTLMTMLLGMSVAPLLSPKALDSIANHKYKAGSYTPLDTFLSPHLQTITDCLPRWLAPNLITLGGAVPMTLGVTYLAYVCPTFEEDAPQWLLCFFPVALIFYLICDAIDGKQARRTGSSSPLGQIFDHGVDCLMVIQIHWVVFAVVRLHANWALPLQAGGQLLIFLGHWEEHFTHVFRASVGVVGVTEVTIGMSLFTLAGGLMSPEVLTSVWRYPLGVANLELRQGVAIGWILFVFCVMYCYATVGLSAAGKAGRLNQALFSLLPVSIIFLGSALWQGVAVTQPRYLSLVIGLLFYLNTAQMILYSMALESFCLVQPSVAAFAALIMSSWFLERKLFAIVLVITCMATVILVSGWTTKIISQLADRLDTGVFVIRKRST